MIGSLRGKVLERMGSSFLLEVAGVGYLVRISVTALESVAMGSEVLLYIHDHVREDTHDLFGFLKAEELALFEQLLGISGVGPKVGMTLLSLGSVDTVRRAIMSGDIDMLTSIPGVGKKTAQKIILELKGQLVEAEASPKDYEVVDALQSLGYSASQARDAIKSVPEAISDTSERLREALRQLSKNV